MQTKYCPASALKLLANHDSKDETLMSQKNKTRSQFNSGSFNMHVTTITSAASQSPPNLCCHSNRQGRTFNNSVSLRQLLKVAMIIVLRGINAANPRPSELTEVPKDVCIREAANAALF
jgi:hypothetical protein